MIESKDASKSDERQVKNTPKPLTQKRKGETHTMGNRGMTNWKLGAFFIISLMLCAGLFSNTAIAADGGGTVTVGWESKTSDAAPGTIPDNSESANTAPLNAGTRWNAIQITYTAADGDNMGGGLVRVDLPGWAMAKIATDNTATTMVKETDYYRFVTITSTPNADDGTTPGTAVILYSTTGTALNDGLGTASAGSPITGATALSETQKEALAMVKTLSNDRVEVELSTEWNNGGTLTIVLGDIEAGVPNNLPSTDGADPAQPYAGYRLTASSKAKNGTLILLGSQASVRVGTILGTRSAADVTAEAATPKVFAKDKIAREFTIKPPVVYQGEMKRNFEIEFKALGPMYNGSIEIDIPAGIQPDGSSTVSVSSSGPGVGAPYFNDTEATTTVDAGTPVTQVNVPLNAVSKDQTITVRYTADVGATATAGTADAPTFAVTAVTTTVGVTTADTPATKVTGGMIATIAGSGDVTLNPTFAAVGTPKTFSVKYTALTALTDATLQITPMGVVIVDDPATTTVTEVLSTTNSAYGYVRTSSTDARKGDLSVDGTMIEWDNLTLKKGESVTTTVGPVNVMSRAGKATWTVALANNNAVIAADGSDNLTDVDSETKGNQTLDFYATEATASGVAFAIANPMDYPAGSKQIIQFQFTANATPIRDGYVRVQLPPTWTAPNTALKDAAKAAESKLTKDDDGKASVSVSGGMLETPALSISGHTITVNVDSLDQAQTITITYGKVTAKKETRAVIQPTKQDEVKIYGYAKASPATSEIRTELKVNVTNAADGSGTATIKSDPGLDTIQAGSSSGKILVTFTAPGTMTDGHVILELPSGWGAFQRDNALANYIEIMGSGATLVSPAIGSSSNQAIAKINARLGTTGSFTFVYGGGNGSEQNGVDAQDHLGPATFMIKSDGDGDMVFAPLTSETKYDGTEAAEVETRAGNPHRLMNMYAGYPGQLRILVGGAAGGSGSAVVDKTTVRAAEPVTLKFTYTATQTITDGNLKFTVPGGWSMPQTDDPSQLGYTEATGSGIGAAADDNAMSVIVPITFINNGDTIVITYGLGSEKAVATTVDGDPDTFTIQIEGTKGSGYKPIGRSPAVTVQPQASGKGTAHATVTADADGSTELYAGEAMREIVVVYTATGQMVAGQVKLTVPKVADGWSAASADHVTVMDSAGSALTPMYGADETPATQAVIVTGINLPPNGTVTFVYTGSVALKKTDGVAFTVATHGGLTGDDFANVADTLTHDVKVDVGYAKAGSGMAMVNMPVIAPSPAEGAATAVTLVFTYTAAGETIYPKDFRVRVPTTWSATVAAADYTVVHKRGGVDTLERTIEKLNPIVNDMVARAKNVAIASHRVNADDEVEFTYTTTAPVDEGVYPFQVLFDGALVEGNTSVLVQGTSATTLAVSSAGMVSSDAGAAPLAVTVSLQDDAGVMRATATDQAVTLTASAGSLSATADGAGSASLMVTIPAGGTSAMAYYSNSTAGTATITATAPGSGLTASMPHTVTVTTSVVEITSEVTVSPALASAGDTVTVSVMGSSGNTAMFSVSGGIVTTGTMTETAGTYSGSFDVVADLHADGTYTVTVNLNGQSAMGSLTIDSTAPAVAVTTDVATAENGDTVMISAAVTEAGTVSSVSADVSALDSTQTAMVALTMGTDGSYSASHTISADNAALNGAKTITVTAMDAAGNSGMGTASVELDNKLSYTSTIPVGTSLFHVPLDVEGLDTVGDLTAMIGDAVSLAIVYDTTTGSWNSRSDDVAITADLGIVLSTTAEASVTFEGAAWGGGTSMISLSAGANLVGLPLDSPSVTNVSDIITLGAGAIANIVVSTADGFASVGAAGDPADGPVAGDAAYLVTASTATTIPLLGDGWSNADASAAPIALAGYNVDGQTAVLDVNGAVVDEITGLAREGFRVKVKNLSTKAALSEVTSVETAESYNMTFVDLKAGLAARVGDVLEISADSPDPLIGVKPVRHIITIDDVKSSRIQLEELVAYEIPAETALLNNYPNPFNPETWIPYHLAEDADVSLTIYDANGALVRTIDIGHQTAAKYDARAKAIYWDGRNRFGEQVASGIYFYSLSAGDFSATRKMVILK